MSNFYCLPGRAGGSPNVLEGVILAVAGKNAPLSIAGVGLFGALNCIAIGIGVAAFGQIIELAIDVAHDLGRIALDIRAVRAEVHEQLRSANVIELRDPA